jgi:DNA-binding transcriptional regulator PaaX
MKKVVKRKYTSTEMMLRSLVPFTEQNLKLAFKPGAFFRELERATNANRNTLAATMSRARRNGLVEDTNGIPTLTKKGRAHIKELQPEQLTGWLMVTFDVPETRRAQRDQLRYYLKLNNYKTLQKSVWYTSDDRVDEIKEVISELKLGQHVCLFIAASVFAPDM